MMYVCAGDNDTFSHREFSFTLEDDVYVRYQSFDNQQALEESVKKNTPYKIDIGAIFSVKVSQVLNTFSTLLYCVNFNS